nr:TonB-dependent receptor [Pedobacter sp. SYSU D00535]
MALLMPFIALAQISISGTVTDKTNNQPLPGATVRVGDRSAQTNEQGSFTLTNLNRGAHTLVVTYLGYGAYSRPVQLDGPQNIRIGLTPTSLLADQVIVTATRAGEKTPTTFRNVSREELERNNLGQDLPYLLNQTPSVVVSSDAGAGIGYTGIRIRGSDPTRVNVTINGIPYNDPESQGTFWVNLPDFASSVENIQIQRGVGTSTNGAGAFGGSLNIQTTTRKDSAYAELNNSIGSFETIKNTVLVGTGLIDNKFTFDGRLSRIKSDGYIQPGFSNLKSYFLSGAYYGKKDVLRANVFSGNERTYQAWNGVPEAMLPSNRRYNGFNYEDQTDNYTQDHYQLLYTHTFSPRLNSNVGLHYTYGRGYYEEFKEDQELADYGLDPVTVGSELIENTNLVRRRWLDNDFYGVTYSLNYKPSDLFDLTLGGGYNEYDGGHFGEVIWAQFASNSRNQDRYYQGYGFKTDFNIYGRANYQINNFNLFGDLQYRGVNYDISGLDKNRAAIDQNDRLHFFNPKIGLSYLLGKSTFYGSFAIANKEPNRDDYVNSTPATRPSHENLKNVELGFRTSRAGFAAGINGYGMFYKNQLVLTGRVNESGEYIRENVRDSYRIGLEGDMRLRVNNSLNWNATASISQNKVDRYVEFVDDYDNETQQQYTHYDTDIAFSPRFIASNEFAYRPFRKTEIALLSKYVSKQYLDNTSNEDRKISGFFVNDLRLSYNTPLKQIKNLGVTLLINNLFNELYESNGYTFSYFSGGFTTENYYYPQAERNFLLQLSLKF